MFGKGRRFKAWRPNRVLELTPVEVQVETERSQTRARGAESIPAWMFNLAWEQLSTYGRLSNSRPLIRSNCGSLASIAHTALER